MSDDAYAVAVEIKSLSLTSGKDRLNQFLRARALFSLDLMIQHCKRLIQKLREQPSFNSGAEQVHAIHGADNQPLDSLLFDQTDSCLVCYWVHGEGQKLFGLYRSYTELLACHEHYHDLVNDLRSLTKQDTDPLLVQNLQTGLHQTLKQTTEQLRNLRALA